MKNNWEIIVSGSGGQGVITAGIILADAALRDGFNVIQTQSYGPEARGGASRAEVLISDGELAYPKVQNCNLMVALTQQALDKYGAMLSNDGILITDKDINTDAMNSSKIYKAPIFEAVGKLERPMVANILLLGILNEVTQVVHQDTLTEAVKAKVPAHTIDLNIKALSEGMRLGKELIREG